MKQATKIIYIIFIFLNLTSLSLLLAQRAQNTINSITSGCFCESTQISAYNKNSSLQWQWAINSLENYKFLGTEKVLDVGCGDGKITALITKQASCVTGIDISRSMIDFALTHYPKKNYPNLTFMQKDIEQIDFNNQFDLVISFCTLHWLRDQTKALDNIYKALVSSGKVLIVLPAKSNTNISILSEKLVKKTRWCEHFKDFISPRSYYNAQEYKEILINIGFKIININETQTKISFKDRKALKDWIVPINPYAQHLATNLRAKFLDELVELILKHSPTETNGIINLNSTKLEVVAQKI